MTSWEHDIIPKIKELVEEHRVDMLDKKQMAEHASRDEDATRQERLDRQAEAKIWAKVENDYRMLQGEIDLLLESS